MWDPLAQGPGMWGRGEEPTAGKEGIFYGHLCPGPNVSREISRPASGYSFAFKLLTPEAEGDVSLDPASSGVD